MDVTDLLSIKIVQGILVDGSRIGQLIGLGGHGVLC
jgi:hypothetical protein